MNPIRVVWIVRERGNAVRHLAEIDMLVAYCGGSALPVGTAPARLLCGAPLSSRFNILNYEPVDRACPTCLHQLRNPTTLVVVTDYTAADFQRDLALASLGADP